MSFPIFAICRHCGRNVIVDEFSISHESPVCQGFLDTLDEVAAEMGLEVERRAPGVLAMVIHTTHDSPNVPFVSRWRGQA
jgi:hypothetical protein